MYVDRQDGFLIERRSIVAGHHREDFPREASALRV